VRIPGGAFSMGSRESEEGRRDDEGPLHEVTLSPNLIAKFELRQDEWDRVMATNPTPEALRDPTKPVTYVPWSEGKAFCERAGLQLPTEAQWEFACRAGSTEAFATGERLEPDEASFDGRRPYGGAARSTLLRSLLPVGDFSLNRYGIHDLHGDSFEWFADDYDPEFYSKVDATRADPVCRKGGDLRVVRGACFGRPASECRSARRGFGNPKRRCRMGMRVAFSPLPGSR